VKLYWQPSNPATSSPDWLEGLWLRFHTWCMQGSAAIRFKARLMYRHEFPEHNDWPAWPPYFGMSARCHLHRHVARQVRTQFLVFASQDQWQLLSLAKRFTPSQFCLLRVLWGAAPLQCAIMSHDVYVSQVPYQVQYLGRVYERSLKLLRVAVSCVHSWPRVMLNVSLSRLPSTSPWTTSS